MSIGLMTKDGMKRDRRAEDGNKNKVEERIRRHKMAREGNKDKKPQISPISAFFAPYMSLLLCIIDIL